MFFFLLCECSLDYVALREKNRATSQLKDKLFSDLLNQEP